jgi:hypothetical protein
MADKYFIMTATNLQFFTGFTLVDITATGVIRGLDNELGRNQQRNWETVLQCISLRTQPHHITGPFRSDVDNLSAFEFGDFYQQPNQTVWTFGWSIETADAYNLPNVPLGALQQDFEQVPVITGLTETARFMLPIFYPYGTIKNIYVKQHKSE